MKIMTLIEGQSRGDHRSELVRAIARPGRNGSPQDVIKTLTNQGADPCTLRRDALAYVYETGGPANTRIAKRVMDTFAEHDAITIVAGAEIAPKNI